MSIVFVARCDASVWACTSSGFGSPVKSTGAGAGLGAGAGCSGGAAPGDGAGDPGPLRATFSRTDRQARLTHAVRRCGPAATPRGNLTVVRPRALRTRVACSFLPSRRNTSVAGRCLTRYLTTIEPPGATVVGVAESDSGEAAAVDGAPSSSSSSAVIKRVFMWGAFSPGESLIAQ